jgi:hypothetical protein
MITEEIFVSDERFSVVLKMETATTMPSLRRSVTGFSPLRPGFGPTSGHVGFLVDKMTLGQVFSEYLDFP